MFDTAMRKKDREITDPAEITAILQNAQVLYLAMCRDKQPYVLPLFYGFEGDTVYLHSAPKGLKVEILKENPLVSFSVVSRMEIITAPEACDWGLRSRSAVGFGRAELVSDPEEKVRALSLIMAHYGPQGREWTYPETTVRKTLIIRIRVEEITGKADAFLAGD